MAEMQSKGPRKGNGDKRYVCAACIADVGSLREDQGKLIWTINNRTSHRVSQTNECRPISKT
jgi:hypothetical protein